MATHEHASQLGSWFFQALVESAKLNQMTINEEAAHQNKPHSRAHVEYRTDSGGVVQQALFVNDAHVVILDGVAVVTGEAKIDGGGNYPSTVDLLVTFPTGVGLAPFLRRPIPIVSGLKAFRRIDVFAPSSPGFLETNVDYQAVDLRNDFAEVYPFWSEEALPGVEVNVGRTGLGASDYRTQLAMVVRVSQNFPIVTPDVVYPGLYIFWRVIGHVGAY